jgi:pyridoxal phosphate enzyme (YggS family)
MSMDVAENLARVRERIAQACTRVGRREADVTIVAVTKTHDADTIQRLIAAGVMDIGENRIQEYLEKAPLVTGPCRWHLVGTLQSNKATKAIGRFEMIHSVDRLKIAEALSRLGAEHDVTTRVLLEVNTSHEPTKHGFAPAETPDVAEKIAGLPNLRLEGLMTIGPLTGDRVVIRRAFQSLFRLREKIERSLGSSFSHLSMGMSDDFETAVEEGATLVRLGRVLLGERRP